MCRSLRWHIGARCREILGGSREISIDIVVLAAAASPTTWAITADGPRSWYIAMIIVTDTAQTALLFFFL